MSPFPWKGLPIELRLRVLGFSLIRPKILVGVTECKNLKRVRRGEAVNRAMGNLMGEEVPGARPNRMDNVPNPLNESEFYEMEAVRPSRFNSYEEYQRDVHDMYANLEHAASTKVVNRAANVMQTHDHPSDWGMFVAHNLQDHRLTRGIEQPKPELQVFLVNRKMYKEASDVFYKNNHFVFCACSQRAGHGQCGNSDVTGVLSLNLFIRNLLTGLSGKVDPMAETRLCAVQGMSAIEIHFMDEEHTRYPERGHPLPVNRDCVLGVSVRQARDFKWAIDQMKSLVSLTLKIGGKATEYFDVMTPSSRQSMLYFWPNVLPDPVLFGSNFTDVLFKSRLDLEHVKLTYAGAMLHVEELEDDDRHAGGSLNCVPSCYAIDINDRWPNSKGTGPLSDACNAARSTWDSAMLSRLLPTACLRDSRRYMDGSGMDNARATWTSHGDAGSEYRWLMVDGEWGSSRFQLGTPPSRNHCLLSEGENLSDDYGNAPPNQDAFYHVREPSHAWFQYLPAV